METLAFSIPGAPQTKLRPRFSRWKGKVRTYDAQSEEKTTMSWKLKARMEGAEPLEGPLGVTAIFVMERPKSRARLKEIYHTVTPDIDNLVKFLCDAANATLWYDDKQIASLSTVKVYGGAPRTIITVSKLNTGEA